MSATAEKARALRLERLQAMLDGYLDHPPAALETLMSELRIGEAQPKLWEALHAAASRDHKEADLAAAYHKVANGRRLKPLPPDAHAEVLMHAADYFQGILGDRDGAAEFLTCVLEVVPHHVEAFKRLEHRYGAVQDKLSLARLYALVASDPPKPANDLATKALKNITLLTSKTPLPDDACLALLPLALTSSSLFDVLEKHCLKTQRPALACKLREQALADGGLKASVLIDQRRHLIDLYIGEANTPALAIDHVEFLLSRDVSDNHALSAAEKLLSNREVGSRAAAALHEARKQTRRPSVKPPS